jgi:Cu/Zn superoxide dismutase
LLPSKKKQNESTSAASGQKKATTAHAQRLIDEYAKLLDDFKKAVLPPNFAGIHIHFHPNADATARRYSASRFLLSSAETMIIHSIKPT